MELTTLVTKLTRITMNNCGIIYLLPGITRKSKKKTSADISVSLLIILMEYLKAPPIISSPCDTIKKVSSLNSTKGSAAECSKISAANCPYSKGS